MEIPSPIPVFTQNLPVICVRCSFHPCRCGSAGPTLPQEGATDGEG
jgi:hypothetical protein